MTQREVMGVDEAVKILYELADTPLMTELTFEYHAKAEEVPTVNYSVTRFCFQGIKLGNTPTNSVDTPTEYTNRPTNEVEE